MLYFGIQFKLHSWKNACEFLWFTHCIITSRLGKLDDVLIINKVKQTLLYLFIRLANNDVYYCGDLTALTPYFHFLKILSAVRIHVFCSKFLFNFKAVVQIGSAFCREHLQGKQSWLKCNNLTTLVGKPHHSPQALNMPGRRHTSFYSS